MTPTLLQDRTHQQSTNTSTSALLHRLGSYQPTISFTLDFGEFEVRIARNNSEVENALRLRTEVFFHSLNLTAFSDIDIDSFDLDADHLILVEKKTDTVVGTYRMLCSENVGQFYSETEFEIDQILALPGVKLELGRACIHPNHRNSAAINMLWKGMVKYFTLCGASYMFGCSSVDASKADNLGLLDQWLTTQHISSIGRRVYPRHPVPEWMSLQWHREDLDAEQNRRAERLAPALLKAYLRAGAVVCGEPAWDPVFNTFDYFTLFDLTDLNESYGRKFGL